MQIWRILQTEGKPDEWEKEETDPFPLPAPPSCPSYAQPLCGWLLDRVTRDLKREDTPSEYWVVFSPEENRTMLQMLAPLTFGDPWRVLGLLLQSYHLLQVTCVSESRPIHNLEERPLLAVSFHRKLP